ncbi:MAG: EF-hand domain-containing protein [Thiobacillus sp.]|nr:EF-hand domain-containing protein [Thiobacillus sp.]
MKSGSSPTKTRLAALLLGGAMLPAYAVDPKGMPESGMSFKDYDSNRDGYLSLEEFKAKGKDDLAFKAADIDGDERLDRSEFDKYLTRKASDQAKPATGTSGQPKPGQPPAGN